MWDALADLMDVRIRQESIKRHMFLLVDWFLAQRTQHQIPMQKFDLGVQPHIPIMLPVDIIPFVSAPSDRLDAHTANQVKPAKETPAKNDDDDDEYYGPMNIVEEPSLMMEEPCLSDKKSPDLFKCLDYNYF